MSEPADPVAGTFGLEPSAPKASSSSQPAAYPDAAELPTQIGPKGLRFDFNDGCRVLLPESEQQWRVRLSDIDTGNVLYETEIKAGLVRTAKHYYLRARIEAWQGSELVFAHDYSARDREVLIQFQAPTLGDTIAWFPSAAKFHEQHACRLTCAMAGYLIPLFREAYPDISFVTASEIEPGRFYASYKVMVYYNDVNHLFQPCDHQQVGLQQIAAYLLGVDPGEVRPRLALADEARPIAEPYVCIATQSTMQCKYWNNPAGWSEIVAYLKAAGYRVVCIDQKALHGEGMIWNRIPAGAEDETGDRPLLERARWIRHAEFFVGLSSGLSWLAWALGKPVVMISGFTHSRNEFATPYRVINYHTCNSCWNDVLVNFDRHDFLSCPRHKNTPRQFECTRLITAEHVKATIRQIPGFGQHAAGSYRSIAAR